MKFNINVKYSHISKFKGEKLRGLTLDEVVNFKIKNILDVSCFEITSEEGGSIEEQETGKLRKFKEALSQNQLREIEKGEKKIKRTSNVDEFPLGYYLLVVGKSEIAISTETLKKERVEVLIERFKETLYFERKTLENCFVIEDDEDGENFTLEEFNEILKKFTSTKF